MSKMISDGSESESDVSVDSESEKLAVQAFKLMKLKLPRQKNCQGEVFPSNSVTTCTGRRKVYDTFVSNSDNELTEDILDNEKHVGEVQNELFYLDKGPVQLCPSVVNSSNFESLEKADTYNEKSTDQTEIEVTDLSYLDVGEDFSSQEMQNEQNRKKKDASSKNKSSKNDSRLENLSTSLKSGVNCKDIYVNVNPYKNPQKQKKITSDKKPKELEIMKKCVITDDFEKQDSVSPIASQRQKQKQRKLEREKTKGDKWFHMAAPEITEERKHDLEVLQMRKALNPKRFYKSNDTKVAPKYFQFGQVVDSPADFYSSRIPKKQRKSTMVEELLADAEFRRYNKRKYEEIQEMKRLGKGPYQRMKRLRKKKKHK